MLYLPKHFKESDPERALALIRREPFATLIGIGPDGEPSINHLPLVPRMDSSGRCSLIGHMAAANPQASAIAENGKATAVFHGPHTYVTPTWYPSEGNVPTWNYAVVHVTGRLKWVREFRTLTMILRDNQDTILRVFGLGKKSPPAGPPAKGGTAVKPS